MKSKSWWRILSPAVALVSVVVAGIVAGTDPKTEVIEREREALTRWGEGDPFGYIELASEEITYFDPSLEKRIDGKAAFKDLLTPLAGKIHIHRFEMENAEVQLGGDIAVLSFNLTNYNANDSATSRWNSTEVYRQEKGEWMLLHSHWSYTKPDQE